MAWVSAIVGIVGAGASAASSDKASGAAVSATKEGLKFQRKQYRRWLSMYGGVQENLSKYYNDLTPGKYEATNLQAYEREYAEAIKRIDTSFAQRGIEDSGLALATRSNMELGRAKARVDIRQDAETETMKEKLGFLQVGLGQNPTQQLGNALSQNATYLQGLASTAQQQAGEAFAYATKTVGSALSDEYAAKQKKTDGGEV